MRVARILLGIIMVSISVLAFLGGAALWIAMQHESSDGGFGGMVTGLPAAAGTAIVVPDVNALLRSNATLTARSGTSVIVSAASAPVPAFIGIGPLSAIRAYLGPAAYTRITGVHTGFGGISVTAAPVTAQSSARVPGGAPTAQGFWSAKGTGRLSWSPSDHRYDGLALIIMRADGAGPLTVTTRAEVKPDWLASTAWALFSVGTAVAVLAVALLIWPMRRRDVVYVVEPAQLPEIASRLGLTLVTSQSADDADSLSGGSLPGGSVIARIGPGMSGAGAAREKIWRMATRWAGSTARHRLDNDEVVPSVFGPGIPPPHPRARAAATPAEGPESGRTTVPMGAGLTPTKPATAATDGLAAAKFAQPGSGSVESAAAGLGQAGPGSVGSAAPGSAQPGSGSIGSAAVGSAAAGFAQPGFGSVGSAQPGFGSAGSATEGFATAEPVSPVRDRAGFGVAEVDVVAGSGCPGSLPADVLAALTVHTDATPILGTPAQRATSGAAQPAWAGPTRAATVVGFAQVVTRPAPPGPAPAASAASATHASASSDARAGSAVPTSPTFPTTSAAHAASDARAASAPPTASTSPTTSAVHAASAVPADPAAPAASAPVASESTMAGNTRIPDIFADPKTRPNSLRTAMLLDFGGSATGSGMPAPTRTNERGTYRTVGTPPLVTPAFLRASSDE